MEEYNNSSFIRYLNAYDDALIVINRLKRSMISLPLPLWEQHQRQALTELLTWILFPVCV